MNRSPAQSMLALDLVVDCPLWKSQRGVDAMLRRAVAEAASMVSTSEGELAIVLTDDSAIRALNRDWRGKDEPTNVLSFPADNNLSPLPLAAARPQARNVMPPSPVAHAPTSPAGRGGRKKPRMLGDIVIAYETAAREALAAEKPLMHHVAHLAVHGFLHLVGYDHEVNEEADAMERLEVAILARLDVPDPYLWRAEL
jgi:probable rRNA maturation factor